MPQQFENPQATIVEDETVSNESFQNGIDRVAEKAAEKGAKTEQEYDKNHGIFTVG